jgi:DNA-directed RNA polymerase specialized sigma24 family protein
MPMPVESLDSCSTQDLAQACAQSASRRRASPHESDPCYELFRRALAPLPDQQAWEAILNQYHRLVRLWLGQYAEDDTLQETFARFWQAQTNTAESFAARFPDIKSVMGYLKSCALTVRFRAARAEARRHQLLEHLQDLAQTETASARLDRHESAGRERDLKAQVLARLKGERERVVFESSYHYDLPPREILQRRPGLFANVREVSRVKENLLKRLRRDKDLKKWWTGGGNSFSE